MLLIKVHLGEPEYVLVQHGQVVAYWFASTMWGSVAKRFLERLDFRVEEVDATTMVESFKQFGDFRDFEDEDGPYWEIPALIQAVIEEFGVEALRQPLERDQALHLWEKAIMLEGLVLPEKVHLREF
jgi:glutaredoxin-related protein